MAIGSARIGAGFSGLSLYLLRGIDGESPERVAWTATRNLPSERPEDAARVMESTAAQNHRVERPVYHVSINWHPDDHPTPEEMAHAADRLLGDLGLRDHQALLVAHNDTAHPHVHIMVNRVHPEHRRTWDNRHDWGRIEHSLRRIEREMGWRVVPGRHTRIHRAPEREAVSILDRAREPMHEARSWAELEHRLQEKGLALKARGRGLVVTDGQVYVKASSVHRSVSRGRLEERFGQGYREWRQEVQGVQRLARDHARATRAAKTTARPARRSVRGVTPRAPRAPLPQARQRAALAKSALEGTGHERFIERKLMAFAVRHGLSVLHRISPAAAAIVSAARTAKRALDRERGSR